MSAPDTNLDRQEKKHRPSLWGIKGAMAFGALMMILLLGFNMINAGDGEAVTNADESKSTATAAETDTYSPGTNNSETPAATE
ncbi:hypothetical protein [Sulfitobacter guttiformis]|uniref:Uncharacterized protein n=1 Tax=Sulfitobacter guttiformis TaxID=74349 RepID=A0A420DND0_9RHOB|nr:hypothetical protein [Sulfitobacter guttiformis]KIN73039.1 hypothetical protein Z949_2221 [Sulfitobacter guttiformis KCTC 32187]RKE95725.1 hypothetical protein C8N30_0262 [Sulfitobacter guttiformis]